MRELLAEGRIEPPRGAGPDKVPLDFCLRHEAEYVSGTGVDGTIARVKANATPYSRESIPSGEKVQVVIELNAGRAAQLGIAAGDRVSAAQLRN
jgi:hypothetical protein